MELKHKVFAYITHGDRLLVFDHPQHPQVATQVPSGTREETETPEVAVLREAEEETGLSGLTLQGFLGEVDFSVPERCEIHRRRFYHLTCKEAPADRWQHYEELPSDGTTEPILFELYWVSLPDGIPALPHGHDALLAALFDRMNLNA
jgi:8-oxo-dGTP diphosphatase